MDIIKLMVKIANDLDEQGMNEEADTVDEIMDKSSKKELIDEYLECLDKYNDAYRKRDIDEVNKYMNECQKLLDEIGSIELVNNEVDRRHNEYMERLNKRRTAYVIDEWLKDKDINYLVNNQDFLSNLSDEVRDYILQKAEQ